MKTMNKLRWGVLGYARIARENLIPAILRSSNSVFHALASREDSKLAECQARFNVQKTFSSYDELLRETEVDAVYIPLPNSLHCEWTMKAAEQGKHILCEKPIALNAAECRKMIAAAKANRVKLMEAFMYRYTDRTRQVREILRSGALGEVKFVGSTFRFLLSNPASIKLNPGLGGGALYDVGCYPLNFIGLVRDTVADKVDDTMPESVSVEWTRAAGVDMMVSAVLKYPDGLIAELNCGFNAQKRVQSEIVGTRGALEIPDTFLDNAGAMNLVTAEESCQIPVASSDRYRLEVEDFAEAILQKRPPRLSFAETLRNAEIMDRLFAAGK